MRTFAVACLMAAMVRPCIAQDTSIRPFKIHVPDSVLRDLKTRLASARIPEPLQGAGAWTYVDDMVAGVLLCLERPEAVGQAFNIGNPRSTVTIYDLAQRVRRLLDAPVGIVFEPHNSADVELRIPSVEKARELLGWEPQVELDDGLARTIAWYREKLTASV